MLDCGAFADFSTGSAFVPSLSDHPMPDDVVRAEPQAAASPNAAQSQPRTGRNRE
jgi:hypothetical protein